MPSPKVAPQAALKAAPQAALEAAPKAEKMQSPKAAPKQGAARDALLPHEAQWMWTPEMVTVSLHLAQGAGM